MRIETLKTLVLITITAVTLASCDDLIGPIEPTPVPQNEENQEGEPTKNPDDPFENPGDQNGGSTTVAMSYKTVSGNWTTTRTYQYNSNGKLSRVTWRSETPFVQTGSYTYDYNQDGKLTSVTNNHGDVEEYIWENDRVVRKNILLNGAVSEYQTYTYNEQGFLANVADYYLKYEGHYGLRGINELLYFTDGNLYTSMYYSYNVYTNSFELNSSKTYDNYIDAPNPIPMVEVIPGVIMQNKLPLSHTVTIGKQTINYWFTYDLRSDGYPLTRTSSSEYGNELTTYQYY
ncbi:MAG: hypothetical protein KDC93_00780 [Cyclobacteriaceae bacterium]|nr:hypothetical protein [Cyclobacteriaceae bacterium]